ncbi:MAG: GGDEF domain-containing protein [Proteobacteria bacterium]|nr:GGDEF domain-containing protein [Pseudomonadota bacterium]
MRHLLDLLLTTDVAQRARLVQAAMVTAALAALALALVLLALAGHAPRRPVLWWALLAPGGSLALFALVRSGWTRRFADPALTLVQMVGGGAACALAYSLAGAARGGVFLVLMALLLATMLSATPRQMRQGCIAAAVLLGLAMVDAALRRNGGWPWGPWVEAVHLALLAALLPAAPLLASRWARMRARSQRQQQDLQAALVRIRELATRDELTGLVNRRQMRELMSQEHQRCIRSGRTFCLGVLDIDRFRDINEQHGRSAGDAVLRSVAHEALRRVRVSDAFGRWSGDRFVLLLADARAPLAKGGLERVRSGVGSMRVAVAAGDLQLTLSAGLAEHHAGETVEQTLDRAERALAEAKQQGRDRLVCLG